MKKVFTALALLMLMTVSAYADIVPFSMYRPANDVERVVKADVLPVSFDLRNNYVIPPVRHQYFWGTCWAFAVMASNESNYLMQVAGGLFRRRTD